MYKKYILKRGKRIGPYFYTSVRIKGQSVKSVYLGNNEVLARKKERAEQLAVLERKRG